MDEGDHRGYLGTSLYYFERVLFPLQPWQVCYVPYGTRMRASEPICPFRLTITSSENQPCLHCFCLGPHGGSGRGRQKIGGRRAPMSAGQPHVTFWLSMQIIRAGGSIRRACPSEPMRVML